MYGFMPGFVYLSGLPQQLHIPRKSTPDKRIPANSFAIGGNYAGIYSIASPGGWHILGTIKKTVFNKESVPPLQLRIGQQIIINSISKDDLTKPKT